MRLSRYAELSSTSWMSALETRWSLRSLFDEVPVCLGGCLVRTFELQHQPPSTASPTDEAPLKPNATPTDKRRINSRLTSAVLSVSAQALSSTFCFLFLSSGGAVKGTGSLVVWSRTMLLMSQGSTHGRLTNWVVAGGWAARLFPEDVSDCLACWVSALEWRNQVDRKGGS